MVYMRVCMYESRALGWLAMRRTSEEAEKTRERIFHAGLKVFGDRGYSATTLVDIAREAGTTRGAIYWHFRNKENFFHEIYRRVHARVEEFFESGSQSETATAALRSTMVAVLTDFIENEEWRLMCSLLIKTSWVEQVRKLRAQIVGRGLKSVAEERIRRWTTRGELRAVTHPRLIHQAVKSY